MRGDAERLGMGGDAERLGMVGRVVLQDGVPTEGAQREQVELLAGEGEAARATAVVVGRTPVGEDHRRTAARTNGRSARGRQGRRRRAEHEGARRTRHGREQKEAIPEHLETRRGKRGRPPMLAIKSPSRRRTAAR